MRGLILCAGKGERLRPLTNKIAKPTVPFLNLPMLAFPLFWLEQLNLKHLSINTHYLPETVEAVARMLVDFSYQVKFRHEPEILGSGGAMWNARDDLAGDDFITANGDAVFFFNHIRALSDMLSFHKRAKPLATLLACEFPGVGDTIPGIWVDQAKNVVTFGRGPHPGLSCLHFTGVSVFQDRVLSMLPNGQSNILYDILEPQIKAGTHVSVWVEEMKWYETGRPRDFLAASLECLQMLFNSDGARWYLFDILDRFSPGWRNHSEAQMLASEPPNFKYSFAEKARVLLGKGIHSKTEVQFEGSSVLGDDLDLSGRTATEGIYIPEAKMWIR